MGNLRRKPNEFLLNTVDNNTIQVLADGSLFINEYGRIVPANVARCHRTCTTAGTLKVDTIFINPDCPCDECHGWEGGITVQKKYGLTGDPQDFYGLSKYYGYGIDNLQTCVSGKLAAADIHKIAWNITRAINLDPKAQVTVQQRVNITVSGASDITLTFVDGTTGVASLAGANAAAHALIFNANANLTATSNGTTLTITSSKAFKIELGAANVVFGTQYVILTDVYTEHPTNITISTGFGTITHTVTNVKPLLPNDKVWQVFPILPLSGVGSQPNLPLKDVDYCKYVFYIIHPYAYDHSFANHLNQYYEEVHFYLPATVAQSANWEDKLVDNAVCNSFDESSSSSGSGSSSSSGGSNSESVSASASSSSQ